MPIFIFLSPNGKFRPLCILIARYQPGDQVESEQLRQQRRVQKITPARPADPIWISEQTEPTRPRKKIMRPEAYERKIDELASRHPALAANIVSVLMLAAALLALNTAL
jgi:hypothetical protein